MPQGVEHALGERIRMLRRRQRLTQEGLGRHVRLSSTTIRRLEQGKRVVSREKMGLLARALGVSMDLLLEVAWKPYRRTEITDMRPYVPGEDLPAISVSSIDTPCLGGMIARDPMNHYDQWYVSQEYFEKHMEAL